jgi:uncharacterized protein (TIGR02646 family)
VRSIIKNREPNSLAQHRCQAHADYDNMPEKQKQELREQLATEQGYICSYCMQRIRADSDSMKIEHWHCQTRYPAEQLDYGNLLGVCLGNEHQIKKKQHCDTHKGNLDLSRNPSNPLHNVEVMVQYLGDGSIKSKAPVFDTELEKVINLNHPKLKNNRKAVLDSFKKWLDTRIGKKELERLFLERLIREWSDPFGGKLKPYCMVVVGYLRKRLARL